MALQSIGPLFYVNGPLPQRPRYGLVQSAEIADESDEHWGNGIQVHGYIPDVASNFGVCGDEPDTKGEQQNPNPLPEFGPLTVYVAETCSTRTMGTNQEFKDRVSAVFDAVEGGAVEHEFWTGSALPDNPHLTDANADVLNSGSATSVANGLALLEQAIADTNRAGVIHMTAALALAVSTIGGGGVLNAELGKLYTINGTLVIPGVGYDGSAPEGAADPTGAEQWAFATGPVEILRSEPFVMPPEISQAIDREQNVITYRAERYYLPYWDTALQAAVLIDRCLDTC
jgi:hypothetical protein